MIEPPRWTRDELQMGLEASTEIFRRERLEEPLEDYLEGFDDYQGRVEDLFETTVDLTDLDETALDILTDARLLEAFRYLAGPPISTDDLKTVAETRSLNANRLRTESRCNARYHFHADIRRDSWRKVARVCRGWRYRSCTSGARIRD